MMNLPLNYIIQIMIAARMLLRRSYAPLSYLVRMASEHVVNPDESMRANILKKIHWPAKSKGKDDAASLLDLGDTLKCVNFRYDFPQDLTPEQKKDMKRFDIFR